jgi:hypothetical protein
MPSLSSFALAFPTRSDLRRELEPKIRPIGCGRSAVEARLAVEAVEIGGNELAVFHAAAGPK